MASMMRGVGKLVKRICKYADGRTDDWGEEIREEFRSSMASLLCSFADDLTRDEISEFLSARMHLALDSNSADVLVRNRRITCMQVLWIIEDLLREYDVCVLFEKDQRAKEIDETLEIIAKHSSAPWWNDPDIMRKAITLPSFWETILEKKKAKAHWNGRVGVKALEAFREGEIGIGRFCKFVNMSKVPKKELRGYIKGNLDLAKHLCRNSDVPADIYEEMIEEHWEGLNRDFPNDPPNRGWTFQMHACLHVFRVLEEGTADVTPKVVLKMYEFFYWMRHQMRPFDENYKAKAKEFRRIARDSGLVSEEDLKQVEKPAKSK